MNVNALQFVLTWFDGAIGWNQQLFHLNIFRKKSGLGRTVSRFSVMISDEVSQSSNS
jgi:hypothetical protein